VRHADLGRRVDAGVWTLDGGVAERQCHWSRGNQLPGLVLDLPQHPKRPIQASVGALHAMVGRRPDGGITRMSGLMGRTRSLNLRVNRGGKTRLVIDARGLIAAA